MIGTFFKLVGKAFRFSVSRPLQRFNIANRAKKHLGEDAKYFMPAPRAIGALSREGPKMYPHLEGAGFKSIRQKRLEALQNRHEKLLESPKETTTTTIEPDQNVRSMQKSFSETKQDDDLIIEASNKLPVIKTVINLDDRTFQTNQSDAEGKKSLRPLPKSTSLQLQDIASVWIVNKTPPGRLNLNQLQELMINKLADDEYWTPEKISEFYNIKEEYAQNLITYLKQIRIIISPRMAKVLDYTARDDPVYQATKHIIYHVDKSLRNDVDKQYDDMYLPTDELDEEVREIVDTGSLQKVNQQTSPFVVGSFKRPEPLRLNPINKPEEKSSHESGKEADGEMKRIQPPMNSSRDNPG